MSHALRPAALLALSGLTALGTARLWNPAPAPAASSDGAVVALPARAGAFVATGEEPLDPVVRAALDSARLSQRSYSAGGSGPVKATLIVGGDRDALHDPRSCMVGAGWRIENDRTETLPGPGATVRRCTLSGDLGRFEALYLYVDGSGDAIASPTAIRLRMLGAALRGGRGRPVRFLRLLQPAGGRDLLPALALALWPTLASGRQP